MALLAEGTAPWLPTPEQFAVVAALGEGVLIGWLIKYLLTRTDKLEEKRIEATIKNTAATEAQNTALLAMKDLLQAQGVEIRALHGRIK